MHTQKHSTEIKMIISKRTKESFQRPEVRKNLEKKWKNQRGKVANNKGIWLTKLCEICKKEFSYPIYLKRKCCSKECGYKIKRIFKKETLDNRRKSFLGTNNPNWKGENASYSAIHHWIKSHKPKSKFCEYCKKTNCRIEAANISGEYKRDINDYKWLCVYCHRLQDGNMPKNKYIK